MFIRNKRLGMFSKISGATQTTVKPADNVLPASIITHAAPEEAHNRLETPLPARTRAASLANTAAPVAGAEVVDVSDTDSPQLRQIAPVAQRRNSR